MSDDPRVAAASAVGYAQMRHDPAVWHEALDHALPDMLAAADAVDPLRAPATVSVRLDGLADKIAATLQHGIYRTPGDDPGDEAWFEDANILIALLHSLAVQ